jgi:hypothetical protein
MNTFAEFSDSFDLMCDPEILDVSRHDSEFFIYQGAKPLLTPGGNVFANCSEGLIRMLVTDLHLFHCLPGHALSSPVLYAFRKDIFVADNDPFMIEWDSHCASDPFVIIKTSGNPVSQFFGPEDPLFAFNFITLTGLIEVTNRFTGRLMGELVMEVKDVHPFPALLKYSYARLSPDQKIAVQALNAAHHSGIVLPMLLVLDEISGVDYVKGLISFNILSGALYTKTISEVTGVKTYLSLLLQNTQPNKEISALIREGEGDLTEFKSTLRWDIRAGKANPAIERACLKTITAFLNSKGGILLIGVRDDGTPEGIETDKFANEDKFLLHLWTLIRICLGCCISPCVVTRLEKYEQKTVCVVECRPSDRPVFLRQPGFPEEMYIRVGPSSNALDISDALKYIEMHFHD